MLIVKTDFNITARQVIFSVSGNALLAVDRITLDGCAALQIFQQLLQFCLLINPKSIFISTDFDLVSIGRLEIARQINSIIIRCQF